MKAKLQRLFIVLGLISTLISQLSTVHAQITAFTYQGRLNYAGVPINGIYDFQFALFDAVTNGNQTTPFLTNSAVTVSNGLFTTAIDFGNVFNGSNYWLAIAVSTNGANNFSALSPRQSITATPYSTLANNANNVLGVVSSANLPNGLGGFQNSVDVGTGFNDTVAGGAGNSATGGAATVAGGAGNTATGADTTIAGGGANTASAPRATVSGGIFNTASGQNSAVGGGVKNIASGADSTVSGGSSNVASGSGAFIGGGGFSVSASGGNQASGSASVVGGGLGNTNYGNYATIGGGYDNFASGTNSFIGGGSGNMNLGRDATIAGGNLNIATNVNATITRGQNNVATRSAATIGGGGDNVASGAEATVSGGEMNYATGRGSFVGGGGIDTAGNLYGNTASGGASVVAGGNFNLATNNYSTIPGGFGNRAFGQSSFAAGSYAIAGYDGAFVWSDNSGTVTRSYKTNQFMARASGGVIFYSGTDTNTGVSLAAGSGSWSSLSDRNSKDNFVPVDPRVVLEKVAALPMQTWHYKAQAQDIRHLGPIAQDFHVAFGLGEDNRHITTIDAEGVALAAIQGLNQKLNEKNAEVEELKAQLSALKEVVQSLAARK